MDDYTSSERDLYDTDLILESESASDSNEAE